MSDNARRCDAAWLRAQMEDLGDHLTLAHSPASMQEIRSRLCDIRLGKPWRLGAAERSMQQGRRGRR